MTVSNQNPTADSLVLHGDSFSFDLDDGGTTPSVIQVSVEGATTEVAWTLAGGFQSGFSGTATKTGNVYSISVARTAGWNASPFTVNVDWTISGTPSTASWSYTLAVEAVFPTGMTPRNPLATGTLIITDNGAAVRTDVGWINLVGFTVVDQGNGKVKVTAASGGGGGGGGGAFATWALESTAGAAPTAAGQFSTDSATVNAVTEIEVRDTDTSSDDQSASLSAVPVGSVISLISGSTFALYTVTAVTDVTTYYRYGVTALSAHPDFVLTAAQDYTVSFSPHTNDHGTLSGLGDDDHTIYLKADGTRALTGPALLTEAAAPAAPAAGLVSLYAKTDGLLYSKDDLGTETAIGVDKQGFASWSLSSTAGANTAAQGVSFNSATAASITSIKFNYQAYQDTVDEIIQSIQIGDFLLLRTVSGAPHAFVKVATVTDDSGNSQVIITCTTVAASGTFSTGTDNIDVVHVKGASTFVGLNDTPSTFSGSAGKPVRVNAGGTALEFFTGASTGGTYKVLGAVFQSDRDGTLLNVADGEYYSNSTTIGSITTLWFDQAQRIDSTGGTGGPYANLATVLADVQVDDKIIFNAPADGVGAVFNVDALLGLSGSRYGFTVSVDSSDAGVIGSGANNEFFIVRNVTVATPGVGKVIGLGTWTKGNNTIGLTAADRFDVNNATIASITSIRILASNPLGGAPIDGFVEKLSQGGTLILQDVDNPSANAVTFDVASHVLTSSVYWDLTVTHLETLGTNWATSYSVQFIPKAGQLSGAGAPGVATGNGYPVGAVYADTTADEAYVLTDNTAGANVWSSATGSGGGTNEKEIIFQMSTNPSAADQWVLWGPGGPWNGSTLATVSGGSGAEPTFASTWDDGAIHMPRAATLTNVTCFWGPITGPAAAGSFEMMLVKMPLTDGMTAAGTVTNLASVTDTCVITSVSRQIVSLTLNSTTINANDGLFFCIRGTGTSDLAVNYVFTVTIRYTI